MKKIFSKSLQKVCNYKNRVYICSCQTETIMKEEKLIRLEPFDLEKALNGAKIVTRDGREVTQFTKFEIDNEYCLFGVFERKHGRWTIDGHFYHGLHMNEDLFIEYQVQSVWVNVYRNKYNSVYTGQSYTSKEHALNRMDTTVEYIKTIEINDIPEINNQEQS